ncbi:YheT family hydrolase [Acinetobacter stercoris]|uniref:Putative hydrolase n=1 Tax=Acinetobacter stercoris TaxID=2126983 RepID=A0A2U3MXC9_9GAMM|nr:alpha/beta fold hydrolase [Acinetobacter stercoris]SPL70092.1 putative hydrolase [Acinetobacter stercoris]
MGKSTFKNIKILGENLFDLVVGAEQPKLYFNQHGKLHNIQQKMPQLQKKYRPTPYLSNPHIHLLYFDLIRKKTIKLEYDHFDQLCMPDGGVTAISWYGYALPAETPTIVVLHTIKGTPSSMRELVRDLHQLTGWRIALCLRRGHAGLPMPVPQMSIFGSTSDLREQINFIQSIFPDSCLYAVGSSAGTGLLVRYLGEEGENTPFKAAFALCPGYDTEEGFENVHPFYTKIMTRQLFNAFIHPYRETWKNIDSVTRVLSSKTLAEFQQHYFEMAGYTDYQCYSKAINPVYVFENIKIPLMILNAEDDPVCHIKNLEPFKETISNMDNVVVVTTRKGSHCGFYEGWKTQSWSAKLMSNFLKLYANDTKH